MNAEVVIAVRGGPDAKTRLSGKLDSDRRNALVEAMLADMLEVLARCPSVRRVHVATPTPALARLAARRGAVVILEHGPGGLNGAFDRARARIAALDPGAVMVALPGDLPRLEVDELETFFSSVANRRLLVAPASADGGTGALAFRADLPFPFAFGAGSFGKHLAAARALGLETQVTRAPGLGFDLDRPSDLEAFLAMGGEGRTAALLRGATPREAAA